MPPPPWFLAPLRAATGNSWVILFALYAVVTAVVVARSAQMERRGLRSGASGTDGFLLFIVMLFCALAILPVAVAVWMVTGGQAALGLFFGAGLWLYLLGSLAFRWRRGGLR